AFVAAGMVTSTFPFIDVNDIGFVPVMRSSDTTTAPFCVCATTEPETLFRWMEPLVFSISWSPFTPVTSMVEPFVVLSCRLELAGVSMDRVPSPPGGPLLIVTTLWSSSISTPNRPPPIRVIPGGAPSRGFRSRRRDTSPSPVLTMTSFPVPAVTLMLPFNVETLRVTGCDGLLMGTVTLSCAAAPTAQRNVISAMLLIRMIVLRLLSLSDLNRAVHGLHPYLRSAGTDLDA